MTFEDLLKENEALRRENEQLRQENAQQRKSLEKLEAALKVLQGQLEEAQRAGKRQAAPFSQGAPKANPKKPGQKPGHKAEFRPEPKPRQVDRELDATLPAHCPGCGGTVKEERVEAQYQEDIPAVVKPVTTKFNVHIGHCQGCGQRVQGRHAEQTSDALGQAAVQIGPRALALSAPIKHDFGVPYAKIARLFKVGLGLSVNRSTLARADQRLAKRYQPVYAFLQSVLRKSAVVWADETGWKVGGQRAWLWAFTSESLTVYVVDPTRAHEVVERVLGSDFKGTLECDCFLAYDALDVAQQKCLQHLIRRCKEMQLVKTGSAATFSLAIMRLLQGAIHLRHRFDDKLISEHGFRVACGRLESALDRQINRRLSDPDNCKLAKLLLKHRDQLLVFLYQDGLTPTNAPAEQAIRPAVAVRKMSACNRATPGADAHAILTSVLRTCQQQGQDFLDWSIQRLRNPSAALPDWLSGLMPVQAAAAT